MNLHQMTVEVCRDINGGKAYKYIEAVYLRELIKMPSLLTGFRQTC